MRRFSGAVAAAAAALAFAGAAQAQSAFGNAGVDIVRSNVTPRGKALSLVGATAAPKGSPATLTGNYSLSGPPDRAVAVRLPARVVPLQMRGAIGPSAEVSAGPAMATLDGDGTGELRISALVTMSPSTPAGDYVGTFNVDLVQQ